MQLSQFMDELALNRYEKEVILFLSGVDHADAHTLYKATHVPKGRIYSVLNGLVEKGFAQVIPTSPKKYKVEDIKASLKNYLEEEKVRLNQRIQTAGRLEVNPKAFHLEKNAPSVYSFTGREEHLGALLSLRNRTRKKIIQVAPVFVGTFASNLSIYNALRRGVQMQILISKITPENKKNVQECLKLGAEVRIAEKQDLVAFLIKDSEELILSLENYRNQEERLSLISRNKGLLIALEQYFRNLWRKGRKVDKLS